MRAKSSPAGQARSCAGVDQSETAGNEIMAVQVPVRPWHIDMVMLLAVLRCFVTVGWMGSRLPLDPPAHRMFIDRSLFALKSLESVL